MYMYVYAYAYACMYVGMHVCNFVSIYAYTYREIGR